MKKPYVYILLVFGLTMFSCGGGGGESEIIEPEFVIDTLEFGAPIALCKLKISLDD